jgi:hypothetical protein
MSLVSVNAVLRALVATMPSRRTPTERALRPSASGANTRLGYRRYQERLEQDIEIGRETASAVAEEVAERGVGNV